MVWLRFGSLLFASVFLGCPAAEGDDDDSAPTEFDPLRHDDRLGAWVEFVEDQEAEARMAFAAANELSVNLAMKQGEHGRDRLRTWCLAAEAHDVAFRIWPLVSEEDGYWANQANAELYTSWAAEMVDWSLEDCPRLDGIAFDMEFPIERAFELQSLMVEGGVDHRPGRLLHRRDRRGGVRSISRGVRGVGQRHPGTGAALHRVHVGDGRRRRTRRRRDHRQGAVDTDRGDRLGSRQLPGLSLDVRRRIRHGTR